MVLLQRVIPARLPGQGVSDLPKEGEVITIPFPLVPLAALQRLACFPHLLLQNVRDNLPVAIGQMQGRIELLESSDENVAHGEGGAEPPQDDSSYDCDDSGG